MSKLLLIVLLFICGCPLMDPRYEADYATGEDIYNQRRFNEEMWRAKKKTIHINQVHRTTAQAFCEMRHPNLRKFFSDKLIIESFEKLFPKDRIRSCFVKWLTREIKKRSYGRVRLLLADSQIFPARAHGPAGYFILKHQDGRAYKVIILPGATPIKVYKY